MRIFTTMMVIGFGLSEAANAKAPCKMVDATTLSLRGSINDAMRDCVKALDVSTLTTVIVDSSGGTVLPAMEIGDIIAPYRPHIIIKKACNSSCGNYWLPLARKITFTRKARIVLHGSMDLGILKKATEAPREGKDEYSLSELSDIVNTQDDYATRHNIHRGWLMYRTDYKLMGAAFATYLSGKPSIPDNTKRIGFFVVTELMLKSCLPDIEIEGFEQSYAAKADAWRWKKLAKDGRVSTGTLACLSPSLEPKH